MQVEEIKKLLESHLAGCSATIESKDGRHFNATVVSEEFTGKSRVQQQRLVYSVLGEAITNGGIHALSLKTFTPQEWTAQRG